MFFWAPLIGSRHDASGGGGSAALRAPSKAFPASQITSPVTEITDPQSATLLADVENVLANGGVLRFGAGTFDLSGLTAQLMSSAVRIEGAGKGVTVLTSGFDIEDPFSTTGDYLLGVPQARVEIEDVTFDGWRALLHGGRFVASDPDEGTLNGIGSAIGADCPDDFTAGIALRRVAVENSGRIGTNWRDNQVIDNLFVFDCDFTNLYLLWYCASDRPHNNWLWYNCLCRRFIARDFGGRTTADNGDALWSGANIGGIQFSFDVNSTAVGTADDIRFEHCTFDGKTVDMANYNGYSSVMRQYWLRGGGFRFGCWFRNCLFRNNSHDEQGNTPTTYPDGSGISYTKGTFYFEQCVVDKGAGGGEAVFNTKGGVDADTGEGSDHFTDVLVRNWKVIPSANRGDGETGDKWCRALIGPHQYEATVDNLSVRDCDLIGIIYNHYSTAGGAYIIRNVTAENCTIRGDAYDGTWNHRGAVLTCYNVDQLPADYTLENIRVVGTSFSDKSDWFAVADFDRDAISSLTATDLTLDLTGLGYSSGALVLKDVAGTVTSTPTGEVIGTGGTDYAIRGSGQTDVTLSSATGSTTGARADIVSEGVHQWAVSFAAGSESVVGCAAR